MRGQPLSPIFIYSCRSEFFGFTGQFVILVVVVVIAAAFALMKFGNVLSTTIGTTTSTVETSTKCILAGYNWDAAAKACKDATGNTVTL